jgi:hypothetical protein
MESRALTAKEKETELSFENFKNDGNYELRHQQGKINPGLFEEEIQSLFKRYQKDQFHISAHFHRTPTQSRTYLNSIFHRNFAQLICNPLMSLHRHRIHLHNVSTYFSGFESENFDSTWSGPINTDAHLKKSVAFLIFSDDINHIQNCCLQIKRAIIPPTPLIFVCLLKDDPKLLAAVKKIDATIAGISATHIHDQEDALDFWKSFESKLAEYAAFAGVNKENRHCLIL